MLMAISPFKSERAGSLLGTVIISVTLGVPPQNSSLAINL